MLAVLASAFDAAARDLADQHGAALITPRDLSRPGWQLELARPMEAVAVLWEEPVPLAELDRVVVRLSHVDGCDLGHIRQADRAFVAAEMQSFLVHLLTVLGDRVLNPPSPANLLGPNWRTPQWLALAAERGIPIATGPRRPLGTRRVTVLGGRCDKSAPPELAGYARRLSDAAGLALVRGWFSDGAGPARLVGADLWPDLESPPVAAAIGRWLQCGSC